MSEYAPISICEFVRQEGLLLDKFVEYYAQKHTETPDQWPIELAPGEWEEQFFCFSREFYHD